MQNSTAIADSDVPEEALVIKVPGDIKEGFLHILAAGFSSVQDERFLSPEEKSTINFVRLILVDNGYLET